MEHRIDGVDFFWQWPTVQDTFNYVTFIRELRQKLDENKRKHFLISMTVPAAGVDNWELGFDLEELQNHVDFFNVYSMDYAGPWPNQWGVPTGPSSPMFYNIGARKNFYVDWTMKHYTCKLKQPSMLNMVIPFSARIWNNVQEAIDNRTEVFRNAELKNNMAEGRTQISRWTAEHEGLELSPSSWDNLTMTPYILDLKAKTFLTFEDKRSIKIKTDYAKKMDLGGVWLWSVDMDDRLNSLLSDVFSKEFCSTGSGNKIKYSC